MNRRNWLASAVLVLLCGGILVVFTDIERPVVRWLSCGPLAARQAPSLSPAAAAGSGVSRREICPP